MSEMVEKTETDSVVELDRLSGLPRTLMVKGQAVEVRPLTFMEVVRASKHLTPILKAVDAMDLSSQEVANISMLIETAPEAMIKIASLSIKKDLDWFETLEADEGLDVLMTVYEVNKDFFVQRLLPKLKTLDLGKLNRLGQKKA